MARVCCFSTERSDSSLTVAVGAPLLVAGPRLADNRLSSRLELAPETDELHVALGFPPEQACDDPA